MKLTEPQLYQIVKEELIGEINKCRQKEQNWVFSISCEQELTTSIISDYFNKIKKWRYIGSI